MIKSPLELGGGFGGLTGGEVRQPVNSNSLLTGFPLKADCVGMDGAVVAMTQPHSNT
jgi:hypothetical protein